MPLAICIQHKLESEDRAEKLRDLLDSISDVTFSHEPENKAYCWFRKSPDSILEGEWIAGFEMYDNEQALTVVHRGSPEYQLMRKVSAEEELWGKLYPEIIFLEPWSPAGFLNKGTSSSVFFGKAQSAYVVLTTYTFDSKDKDPLYLQISHVADLLKLEGDVASYLPLARKDGQGSSVTVFEQYPSKEAYDSIVSRVNPLRSILESREWEVTVTTWSDGIGHIRGAEPVGPLAPHTETRPSL